VKENHTHLGSVHRWLIRATLLAFGAMLVLGSAQAQELKPAKKASGPSAKSSDSPILATWRTGQVTKKELAAWQAFNGFSAAKERMAPSVDVIKDFAYWKSLEESAVKGQLDQTPRVHFELEGMRQLVLTRALHARVSSAVTVSDKDVEALYRAHPNAFSQPRKLKLRDIYKSFGAKRDAASVRNSMERIHAKLLAGASFSELAKKESDSQSGPRGGFLGWVDPHRLPPAIAAIIGKLAPGQLSRPVETGKGVFIFLCEETRAAKKSSPSEVRAKLRANLERRRGKEAWKAYEEKLFAAAAPRIDPESSTTVLRLPGYRLDARDLETLVKLIRGRASAPPGPAVKKELLHSWAVSVLAARRAAELGLDRKPEVVEALHWRRFKILAHAELSRLIEPRLPKPSEKELKTYFQAHRKRYRRPRAYKLAVIDFGKPNRDNGKAMVDQAEAVAQRIAAGKLGFAEAARRYSKHASASSGGAIGWQSQTRVALRGPTVRLAIGALRPGETTRLLHLDSGLWMFKLLEKRGQENLTFKEAERRAHRDWLEARLPEIERQARSQWFEKIGLKIGPPTTSDPRLVRWATATEFESYGYDVYRGPSAKGPFHRLTKKSIPGAGTSTVPHYYRYEDTTAKLGKTYYYYVESISTSGHRRRLTPIKESKGEDKPAGG